MKLKPAAQKMALLSAIGGGLLPAQNDLFAATIYTDLSGSPLGFTTGLGAVPIDFDGGGTDVLVNFRAADGAQWAYAYNAYVLGTFYSPAIFSVSNSPGVSFAPYSTIGVFSWGTYLPAPLNGAAVGEKHFIAVKFNGGTQMGFVELEKVVNPAFTTTGGTQWVVVGYGYESVPGAPVHIERSAAAPIPTLSQWGVIALSLLLLNFGVLAMYQDRRSRVEAVEL
jgi:hypothetical protein